MSDSEQNYRRQRELCARHGAPFVESRADLMVGLAKQTLGQRPIYGLRHPPEADGTGWFLWCGDAAIPQEDDQFFQPVHTVCLADHVPEALIYLGLPPGYGFCIHPETGYVDVWQDASLLNVA